MKKYRYLSYIFAILAILMSNVMCALVAYSYCNMQWGIKYSCYSAPASVAFLLIIPYAVGISICAVLAWIFNKRSHKTM